MSLLERFSQLECIERALAKKRANLIEDHNISDKPALIWQCTPTEQLVANVTLDSVKNAIRDGAEAIGDNGWWNNFHAYGRTPALVFDGIASSTGCEHQWVTEFHTDGHFIAASWAFPEYSDHSLSGHGIADFYTDAFRDFGYVAQRLYEAISYETGLHVTCSLTRANELPMVGPQRNVWSKVSRNQLRWPVHQAENPAVLEAICHDMAAQLMRAYGRNYRKS